jgi:glycerol-3-phosphate acyltransferase PlsY
MLAPMNPVSGVVLVLLVGYVVGSIPVAGLVARRHATDLRAVGDGNPGYWNAKATLGRRAAVPVFVGDVAKGAVGAGFGVVANHVWFADRWWLGYVGGGAAMIGHAWPMFTAFRGGRSVLCFVGTCAVVAPVPTAVSVGVCVAIWAVTRRFDWAARVGVFGFPLMQSMFEPITHVAATGVLMCIIGVRFVAAMRS